MEAAITSRGRVRIPIEVREHLGLSPGDMLRFIIQPDGWVTLLPKGQTAKRGSGIEAEHVLVNMTPEAMAGAFAWGDESGREVVDD